MSPLLAQSGHTEVDRYLSAFGAKRTCGERHEGVDLTRMTQSGHWAAKFAVMHNTAETAMMRSVEPGQGNEAALQSRCCID